MIFVEENGEGPGSEAEEGQAITQSSASHRVSDPDVLPQIPRLVLGDAQSLQCTIRTMRVLVLVIGAFPVIVWDMVHNHGAWSNSLAATLQHGLRGIGAL